MQALSGVFVLLSMENEQFQPVTTDTNNFSVEEASDYGEVGITLINASGNRVTDWSIVFILEENESFVERDNLPEEVSNCEIIGTYPLKSNQTSRLLQLGALVITCFVCRFSGMATMNGQITNSL